MAIVLVERVGTVVTLVNMGPRSVGVTIELELQELGEGEEERVGVHWCVGSGLI